MLRIGTAVADVEHVGGVDPSAGVVAEEAQVEPTPFTDEADDAVRAEAGRPGVIDAEDERDVQTPDLRLDFGAVELSTLGLEVAPVSLESRQQCLGRGVHLVHVDLDQRRLSALSTGVGLVEAPCVRPLDRGPTTLLVAERVLVHLLDIAVGAVEDSQQDDLLRTHEAHGCGLANLEITVFSDGVDRLVRTSKAGNSLLERATVVALGLTALGGRCGMGAVQEPLDLLVDLPSKGGAVEVLRDWNVRHNASHCRKCSDTHYTHKFLFVTPVNGKAARSVRELRTY